MCVRRYFLQYEDWLCTEIFWNIALFVCAHKAITMNTNVNVDTVICTWVKFEKCTKKKFQCLRVEFLLRTFNGIYFSRQNIFCFVLSYISFNIMPFASIFMQIVRLRIIYCLFFFFRFFKMPTQAYLFAFDADTFCFVIPIWLTRHHPIDKYLDIAQKWRFYLLQRTLSLSSLLIFP